MAKEGNANIEIYYVAYILFFCLFLLPIELLNKRQIFIKEIKIKFNLRVFIFTIINMVFTIYNIEILSLGI